MKIKMKILSKAILFAMIIAISTNFAFTQSNLDKKVLVTINNENVTAGEFMRVYEKNNYSDELYSEDDVNEYLNLYINFKLKVAEAEHLKMDTSLSFTTELSGYRTQLAKPYFVDESVNEELLLEAYNRLTKDIRASHILIMVDENATPEDTLKAYNKISRVIDELSAGKEFSVAAIEYSEDPSARDTKAIPNKQRAKKGNRGDLGYFTVFNMLYPFESAAYSTEVGEISPIIRTKYGYHIINVTDVKDAMGSAQVAHIFVAIRPDASKQDSLRKTEKVNNIHDKIQGGLSFEDAVLEYSEDKGSIKNNGQLSPFTCNRVVPEFVEIVDILEVGDVSDPIKTDYGYHIVKLIESNKPGSFELESARLKERLTKDNRSRKSEDAVISNIKILNKFKVYPEAANAIIAAIDSSVLNKRFVADNLKLMTETVIKIKKEKYTQYDFAKFVQTNQRIQDNIDRDVYVKQLFSEFENECCLNFMDKNLEANYPEFKELIKEYHDGILLFNLTDEKVWSKAVKDTLGLQDFFESNRKNYIWGERVDATVYEIRDKNIITKVTEIISTVDNDGDIAKEFESNDIKSVKIIPDTYELGDNKYVDQINWAVGISSPVNSDVEDLTVIIKIKEVLPPETKELRDARGLVTADYQNYLETQWLDELKTEYTIEINDDVLEKILIQKSSSN
ncbi:MAG: peptidylprolyl isomerase [Bacteroidales bacterium]|jgi:peptidyl-prolyl cis-trans isomerase SurA|nr:peptidylprolyl isomerase [Bacteroidales bacterium]|tara:strand:+ start:718 stop:2751 length:2034 start_codon:yes stop_codon:yes gene_type:complete